MSRTVRRKLRGKGKARDWQTVRRLIEAKEHEIAVLESMVKGRDKALAALREKVVEICAELEWYATRKIDLAKITPISHKPWADMLLDEIAELRTATRKS